MRLDYLFMSSPNDLTNKEALTVVCTTVSKREATRARKKSKEKHHTLFAERSARLQSLRYLHDQYEFLQLCQSGYIFHNSCFALICFLTLYPIRALAVFDFYYHTKVCNLTEREYLQISDCPFRFPLEDFRLYSRYNNVNYSSWHV